jgi:hypothetical protein
MRARGACALQRSPVLPSLALLWQIQALPRLGTIQGGPQGEEEPEDSSKEYSPELNRLGMCREMELPRTGTARLPSGRGCQRRPEASSWTVQPVGPGWMPLGAPELPD